MVLVAWRGLQVPAGHSIEHLMEYSSLGTGLWSLHWWSVKVPERFINAPF